MIELLSLYYKGFNSLKYINFRYSFVSETV